MIPNVAAFLMTVAHSEGTDSVRDNAGLAIDPYRVCYGKVHVIQNLADHPAVTGEWMGERLPDKYCIRAGVTPPCHSTAAGKYQITRGTWIRLKSRLLLTSFEAEAQDDAAVELLKEAGSFSLIVAGEFHAAVNIEHSEWASLPGSTSGQPQTPMVALLAAYTAAGGLLA